MSDYTYTFGSTKVSYTYKVINTSDLYRKELCFFLIKNRTLTCSQIHTIIDQSNSSLKERAKCIYCVYKPNHTCYHNSDPFFLEARLTWAKEWLISNSSEEELFEGLL